MYALMEALLNGLDMSARATMRTLGKRCVVAGLRARRPKDAIPRTVAILAGLRKLVAKSVKFEYLVNSSSGISLLQPGQLKEFDTS